MGAGCFDDHDRPGETNGREASRNIDQEHGRRHSRDIRQDPATARCAARSRSDQPPGKKSGLPLRAGRHTGEIEIRGKDIGGIAVHAAARVMAQSQPDEVLVSEVVTDLVAGSGG